MSTMALASSLRFLVSMSPRRRRNRDKRCDCGGYHFPHRIGSNASFEYMRSHGTNGCYFERNGSLR